MKPGSEVRLKITGDIDAIWCSLEVGRLAKEAGFKKKEVTEISIAVSELVTNVLRFAGEGDLSVSSLDGPEKGFRIVVEDWGPGIGNIVDAMEDGQSPGRVLCEPGGLSGEKSLGCGLGAVQRLMSRVTLRNKPAGGLEVVAYKLRSEDGPAMYP